MQQGLGLHVGNGAIFRRIGDLQDVATAIRRSQPKILIPFAVEPARPGNEAVMFGRERFGSVSAAFRRSRAQSLDRMRFPDV
jgi:hypothetical protein